MHIIVTYTLKSANAGEFVSELEASGAPELVRREDGCLQYEYCIPASGADRVILLEQWESAEKQAVHMTQPHMETIKKIKEKYCDSTLVEFLEKM